MTDAVIKCDSVYKIFGANAKKMLQEANGNVDAKTFQEKGCIVGVNNASFEVSKGELLVVMGLSGSGKSTLVDALTTLFLPPGKIVYNKAAGATAKERTLYSYVTGEYRVGADEELGVLKPMRLRDHTNYSVILAKFKNSSKVFKNSLDFSFLIFSRIGWRIFGTSSENFSKALLKFAISGGSKSKKVFNNLSNFFLSDSLISKTVLPF